MPRSRTWPAEGDSMIASGATDAEISRTLGVSRTTVAYHRRLLAEQPAQHPGTLPTRGETARSHSIRLTDEEVRAYSRQAGDRGWREWLRDLGRKAAGLD